MEGYAGGLFVPFRDATSGAETYGAGRYLLDTVKGADLGGDWRRGELMLDFNTAYHPSCAYDPKWNCPLAPPESRLDTARSCAASASPSGWATTESNGSVPPSRVTLVRLSATHHHQ